MLNCAGTLGDAVINKIEPILMKFKGGGVPCDSWPVLPAFLPNIYCYSAADIQRKAPTLSSASDSVNREQMETIVRSRTNSRIPRDWFMSQGACRGHCEKVEHFCGALRNEGWDQLGFCLSLRLWKNVLTGVQRWNELFEGKQIPSYWGMHRYLIERYLRIRRVSLKSKVPWFSAHEVHWLQILGCCGSPQVRKYLQGFLW